MMLLIFYDECINLDLHYKKAESSKSFFFVKIISIEIKTFKKLATLKQVLNMFLIKSSSLY